MSPSLRLCVFTGLFGGLVAPGLALADEDAELQACRRRGRFCRSWWCRSAPAHVSGTSTSSWATARAAPKPRSFETGAYFDFAWHLLVRPMGRRPSRPSVQAIILQVDGGSGIGLKAEVSGIELQTNTWRMLGQFGYLYPMDRLQLGGLVGVGGDVFHIDLNSVLPSSRIIYARFGPALSYQILPRFLGFRADFGLRFPFHFGSTRGRVRKQELRNRPGRGRDLPGMAERRFQLRGALRLGVLPASFFGFERERPGHGRWWRRQRPRAHDSVSVRLVPIAIGRCVVGGPRRNRAIRELDHLAHDARAVEHDAFLHEKGLGPNVPADLRWRVQLNQLGGVDVALDRAAAHDQGVNSNRALDARLFTDHQEPVAEHLSVELAVDAGAPFKKELPLVTSSGAEKGMDDGVLVLHHESDGRKPARGGQLRSCRGLPERNVTLARGGWRL